MARIAVDTGGLDQAGARLDALSADLGGARSAFARVADAGGAAGVPAFASALSGFAGLWSASATAIQLGAEHLAHNATTAAGVYERTDQSAMPGALPTPGAPPSGSEPAPSGPPEPSPGPAPSPSPSGG